ncbi:hypothetical protein FXF50_01475 [Micromonospora sp. AP08]|nr:hypothetical protein FXF50_01475 [Micromonospora sp. AP08]
MGAVRARAGRLPLSRPAQAGADRPGAGHRCGGPRVPRRGAIRVRLGDGVRRTGHRGRPRGQRA